MYNPYNNQMYMQDLQGLRDRIDKQMQMQMNNQTQQPTPITQNFQLAPNQSNNVIKYAESIDEVKKELVFADTLFVNKEFTLLWYKNASGEVKTYGLKEIIELDEKDRRIAELEAKINMLIKEKEENEQSINKNDDGTTSIKKSANGKSNKSSNE